MVEVGQRVKLTAGPAEWIKPVNGDEGVIEKVYARGIIVKWDTLPSFSLPMSFEEVSYVS